MINILIEALKIFYYTGSYFFNLFFPTNYDEYIKILNECVEAKKIYETKYKFCSNIDNFKILSDATMTNFSISESKHRDMISIMSYDIQSKVGLINNVDTRYSRIGSEVSETLNTTASLK